MEPLPILETAGLFPQLDRELVSLLRGLAPEDWDRPTVAGAWRVRDVASHLLDGNLRKLSFHRDGMDPSPLGEPSTAPGGLVAYLNRANAQWVEAARRLSPRVLTDCLEESGAQVAAFVASLPPRGLARFAVAWAGEERSENWLDTGREYTERWHHQAQIRDAVGAAPLSGSKFFHPVIEISLRAFPPALAKEEAAEGSAVVFEVEGEGGGAWSAVRKGSGWRLWRGAAESPAAAVRMASDDAWRMLFQALSPEEARVRARVSGDPGLAGALLRARAVMV